MLEKISSYPHLFQNKSIQNFIFLVIIQASNVLISLISMPLLIQSIGVDQFGLVNLSLSVIILLNILIGFGYGLSAPRQVALHQSDPMALSHLVSNIVFSKLTLAIIASIFIIVAVYGFDLFKEYQTILIYSILLLFSEATLPLWFFQGMEKMKLISIANIFSKLLFLAGIVLFIHHPNQAKWVNFLLGGTAFGINLSLLLYIHYELKIRFFKPKLKQILASLKENVLLFLSNFATHISINGGLIILSFFSSAETLGMFSLAERITMVLRMFPALVVQAIYPNASKLYQQDLPRFFRFLKMAYIRIILIGILISIGTYLLAPFIVTVLAKTLLTESVKYLRILAFVPFLACINSINILVLLVTDQKTQLFNSTWLTSLYMIVVGTLLTSNYGGMGLCVALLSTELVIFIICTMLIFITNKPLFNGILTSFFGGNHPG